MWRPDRKLHVLVPLQPSCSDLNCSINLNKPSQQASCVRPEVMECSSITVEDEAMDVPDDSFLLKLEETLKDYITRMEVSADFTDPAIVVSSSIMITSNYNFSHRDLKARGNYSSVINTWPYDHLSLQVQKRKLLRVPGFCNYYTPVFPTQVNKFHRIILIRPTSASLAARQNEHSAHPPTRVIQFPLCHF